ncbi:MAG: prepilin-type N-terminal cleavage/methylation domain-containing protein [bacterium]|nr:prepilin-type N-terminal cleavage/methylation domain-containing protein [bacterium]
MSRLSLKAKGFTLIELLLVIIISGSLITTLYSVMITLPRVKIFNDARQKIIEDTNGVMNRFAILFQDYTIDYEEYFNRQQSGCDNDPNQAPFSWDTGDNGHCNNFTAYGNQNKITIDTTKDQHRIKYCSSIDNGKYYASANCKQGNELAE